ncbi:MAG: hypothetical protein U0Q12_27685, partial [Vicinamibacterales bacterium]
MSPWWRTTAPPATSARRIRSAAVEGQPPVQTSGGQAAGEVVGGSGHHRRVLTAQHDAAAPERLDAPQLAQRHDPGLAMRGRRRQRDGERTVARGTQAEAQHRARQLVAPHAPAVVSSAACLGARCGRRLAVQMGERPAHRAVEWPTAIERVRIAAAQRCREARERLRRIGRQRGEHVERVREEREWHAVAGTGGRARAAFSLQPDGQRRVALDGAVRNEMGPAALARVGRSRSGRGAIDERRAGRTRRQDSQRAAIRRRTQRCVERGEIDARRRAGRHSTPAPAEQTREGRDLTHRDPLQA